ncbi:cation:proton antiporter, partial [candidate division WWE3 bacterium]|nr:cation:proton antiporter [candidate division WWE3 bacterium]
MLIYLVIAFVFISTFLLGKVLEKFRVPWIFAALILGSALAIYNPVSMVTDSEVFSFLAQLGMYFLLFLVGLELDVKELKDKGAFIFKSTFFIIFFEGIVGSIFVHFVFNYSWVISLLISLSFATVGEAILIPILDEFNLVNTTLGQAIIGIGTLDDLIEIFTLVASSFIVGAKAESNLTPVVISLVLMIVLTFFLTRMKKESEKFKFLQIESLFIFVLFVFFLFIGVGSFAEAAPLGALFAGISLRTFLPEERLSFIESEIKSLTYGFFGPLFFLWVGL